MKYLILSLLFLLLRCDPKNGNEYYNLKDSILYQDTSKNIYLKRDLYILRRNESKTSKEIRYFNIVNYKDSILDLKKLIDVQSFHQIGKTNSFIDKNYEYTFIDKPSVFPNITVQDRN